MKSIRIMAALLACAFPLGERAEAQTAAQPEIPGYLTSTGCPSLNQTPCFIPSTPGGAVTLASNINAAGRTATITSAPKGNYILSCVASSWGGATAQLQALGPDGATWLSGGVSALSANGTTAVTVGVGASLSILVTGTPTGLYCSIS